MSPVDCHTMTTKENTLFIYGCPFGCVSEQVFRGLIAQDRLRLVMMAGKAYQVPRRIVIPRRVPQPYHCQAGCMNWGQNTAATFFGHSCFTGSTPSLC